MTTSVAPWLEGLSDAWEVPPKSTTSDNVSSANHDAGSLQSSRSKIPRQSLSGLSSSHSRHNSISQASARRTRDPLAPLSNSNANTLQRQVCVTRISGTQSISEASNGSVVAYGTVQLRSKSSSPTKKQQTMEWKRRLIHGEVGYGDQTDMFGPSGLENIFVKGAENEDPKPKNRMGWLQKSGAPMPSSPPPWSPSLNHQMQGIRDVSDESLGAVPEDDFSQDETTHEHETNDSFESNPFDPEDLENSHAHLERRSVSTSQHRSSPDKAFIEPTQDEVTGNRTVSGRTELDQEDFSPVFISKHHTVSGHVNYTAVDSHLIRQFQSMKVDLRHPSQRAPQQTKIELEESGEREQERPVVTDEPEDGQSLSAVQDLSFSENLPTGSPFPFLGKNVQLRRGGYSQCGSFKQKPLSPSQSAVYDSNNPNASGLLSPAPQESDHLPIAPTSPRTPTVSAKPNEPKSRSSGSPLKLFGDHDTFTNNRLLRRLSQLNPDGTLRRPAPTAERNDTACSRKVSTGSSFGNGELDNHAFDAEITITSASDSDRCGSEGSPGSEVPVPGGRTPLGFHHIPSPEVADTVQRKRKQSQHSAAASNYSTLESRTKPATMIQPLVEDATEPSLHVQSVTQPNKSCGEGKRPPTSPFKNPTPKRRRTLHASELKDNIATVNHSYHTQLQEAVSSQKLKDDISNTKDNAAERDILSQRKILRPRNPTPSQGRRQQIEAELREAAENFAEQEPEKLEAVMEQIESSIASLEPRTLEQQAQAVASEVAAFTLRVHKPSGEHGERKRSVTTQDFLNEAMMVMNLIRAKARPQSNLGSVEESDAEALALSQHAYDSDQHGSMLRVSRPPSREGSGWRQPAHVHTDARVISHLRKFQENEGRDETDFIANSIASLQIDDDEHMNDQVVVVDEHSNIRITGPLPVHIHKADSDSRPQSQRSQGSTFGTQDSNGTSTGRTFGTNSTRKSDNVGTLAPDAVAHLIGEQVGGMTFDKDQQRWVRVTKSPAKSHGSFLELPSNVTSDDDPFREISDLPVDEQNEVGLVESPAKPLPDSASIDEASSVQDHALRKEGELHMTESRTTSRETVIPRPVTRDSTHVQHIHSSSVPSRYTAFASSQQEKVEARATSWSDEELARMSAFGKARTQARADIDVQAGLVRPSIDANTLASPAYEASEMTSPSPPRQQLSRDVTTVGNAELASLHSIDESVDQLTGLRDDTRLNIVQCGVEDLTSPKLRQTPSKAAYPSSSTYRTVNRHVSLCRKTLAGRLPAEVHEESELSFVAPLPGDRMMSVSLSVSRPVSKQSLPNHATELRSSPSKGSQSFLLSDLPEFTLHEQDAERPSERALATRLAQYASADVNDRYALAVKELVKILTNVNEDEPYWEDLKHLNLNSRSLASLYGLDDFCTGVQNMDVSNNALAHLHGAPPSIRKLNANSNQLSSLTSWNHLVNLQYLDISNNNLESLDGLGSLIHLRELRADDNDIISLDGVYQLDGLLKLRMRRNKLLHIDLEGSQMHNLASLDISENRISSITYLDRLSSLAKLQLDGNDFELPLYVEQSMPQLVSLSMRQCSLERMEVSQFPNLQHLDLDDNRLVEVDGLSKLKNLDVLSMRRQTLSEDLRVSIFDQPLEARTIRLSGNVMPTLNLSASFLSVRHLELADVGLQDLPDDFGLRMQNLRTLNLSFNNLKDIRPLLNIHKLEQLSVRGNRLYRLRKSVATFAKMTSLQALDLRDNPLTQGFYTSITSTLSRHTTLVRRACGQVLDDDEEQMAAHELSRYGFPDGNAEQDRQHCARLDEDTKLRRRVYEILLANGCRSLRDLDGLRLDKVTAVAKDTVWDRLVNLGIIRKSEQTGTVL